MSDDRSEQAVSTKVEEGTVPQQTMLFGYDVLSLNAKLGTSCCQFGELDVSSMLFVLQH